jgi:hypothetical protein
MILGMCMRNVQMERPLSNITYELKTPSTDGN